MRTDEPIIFEYGSEFRDALDAHASVAITDARGRILYVNDQFCQLSQYSRNELVGQDHRLLNSGRHSRAFMEKLWSTILAGRIWRGELINRAKDGSLYWVITTIIPRLNPGGQPEQFVALHTDITESKQAADVAGKRLAAIVESSDDAVVGKDLNGIITSWNRGAEVIFGYEAAEMVGQSILKLIPADRRAEEARILAEIAEGRSVRHFQTVRRRKDGREIHVSVTVSAVRDATGRIVGASKVARDITEQIQASATILRLNSELEQRVAERTAELEAANRELEAFSYSVSHDLRAPLRAIDGFAQALVEDFGPSLAPEAQRYLGTIRGSAQRMGALIDDLLTFARLSRQDLEMRQLDTGVLVRGALEELDFARKDRDIELLVGTLPQSFGDPALLRQVWLNLLSNAFKYTRRRARALIEVGWTSTGEGGAFFVRDNGTGFDTKYSNKLFGVFQRFHRAEDYEGTGVGLAIVHRIVSRHRGKVWAEAEVDRGATFYFSLGGGEHV